MDPRALIIHIDGSAPTNPGAKVGCAGLVTYPDSEEDIELQWNYGYGTSGSMELAALVNAIRWVNDNIEEIKSLDITRVVIACDNNTVVMGANSWVRTWSNNNWKRKDGAPVRNVSLWKDYIRERRKIRITPEIRWKRGKSDEKTKKVDKLAKKTAKSQVTPKQPTTHLPSVGRSLTGKNLKFEDYSGGNGVVLMRVYYHSYIKGSKDKDCEVRFETIESENGNVIGKFRAYTSLEIDAQIDRHHLYLTEFDGKAQHPRIKDVVELSEEDHVRFREKFVKKGYLKE